MNTAQIYQIYYNEATRQQLDAGFIPLDNTRNERPDWFEFWVIKSFLEQNELQDDVFYGFLSPSFKEKIGMSSQTLYTVTQHFHANADVILLHVYWMASAFFLNPFEQGAESHQGFYDVAQEAANALGWQGKLDHLVTHTKNFAFCNYIIAKKSYWLEWKKWADALFDLCENGQTRLAQQLRSDTTYGKHKAGYAMKVFMQERLPAFILQNPAFRIVPVSNVEEFPLWENVPFVDAIHLRSAFRVCDTLKQKWTESGDVNHLRSFYHIRQHLIQSYAPVEIRTLKPSSLIL